MRIFILTAFVLLSFTLDSLALDSLALPKVTTRTPCPFFNIMLKRMEEANLIAPKAKKVQVSALVVFANDFGIDPDLLWTLAKSRADENGFIDIADLLDPNKLPAHKGSLARADSAINKEFAQIDEKRLDVLVNDPKYSTQLTFEGQTDKYISYEQFKKYQEEVCWSQSEMSFTDRILAKGEAHFIWRFFGAYRIPDSSNTPVIPLKLLDNSLRNSEIPNNFQANKEDPATLCSTSWALLTE